MTRLNLALVLLLVASSLYLVRTTYEARRLYTELERANAEARRLDTELDRLQVEKRAQATPLRVEKLARDQLQMRAATPGNTVYVKEAGAGASANLPTGSAGGRP